MTKKETQQRREMQPQVADAPGQQGPVDEAGPDLQEPARKRGRPRLHPPEPYAGPDLRSNHEQIVELAIEALNLDDETFQIRMSSRPDQSLVDSVTGVGVQFPIVVRPHPERPGEYQVVCGFRRANAARQIGLAAVPAVVRPLDDEGAQVVAFTENEFRKTLREADRARALDNLRRQGKTMPQIAALFSLSVRQVQRISEFLEYPAELKTAVEEGLGPTYALILHQGKRKHGARFRLGHWIGVAKESASVEELKSAIRVMCDN